MSAALRAALLSLLIAAACVVFSSQHSHAQGPVTPPTVPLGVGNIHVSTPNALFDLSSRFLRMLGNEAAWASTGAPSVNNPTGGGADMQSGAPTATQRVTQPYRAWFEGYGLKARMDPQGEFRGDHRETFGAVAGFGVTTAPGVSFGVSVDQGRSKIKITPLAQEATIDLTQVGGNAAFESGPWTLGFAAIHGFGDVDSRRGTGTNVSVASYDANLWGALTELSYLWSRGNWRVVPKLAADWTRTETSAFTETGGSNPVIASAQVNRRFRILAGAEVGHTWFGSNNTMFDVSAYARAVDIVSLEIDPLLAVTTTGGTASRLIPGVSESRFGVDAGGAASYRFNRNARLYAVYDGRFRSNLESHAGTLGLELRW